MLKILRRFFGRSHSCPETPKATGQTVPINKTIAEVSITPEANIFDIPLDVWEREIFPYLSLNDVITLSCVCENLQHVVRTIKTSFDFSLYYSLNINALLKYTLSATCTSINLNHCYWLKPSEILGIISKTNVKHLHVVECEVNGKCIVAISKRILESLSFTLTDEWFSYPYFKKRGLRRLKRLEVFYKDESSAIFFAVYLNVLIYCPKLEHLKVIECPSSSLYRFNQLHQTVQLKPSSGPTVVPELKSLVINLQTLEYDPSVARFVSLILNGKVKPLQHLDLGSQSGYLYQRGILQAPQIVFDKSMLSINCINTDFKYWLNFQPVQELICQPNYNAIKVENVEMDGFHEFARLMVVNSGKSLKEIHLKHYKLFKRGYMELLEGLSHMAINCSQITVMDVSGHKFTPDTQLPYACISEATVEKHKALLNAFNNLKNLKKLAINPLILHCKYWCYNSNGAPTVCIQAMPFWKVTSACRNLMEIRIVHRVKQYYPTLQSPIYVHEDSLYGIACCEKLKALHLTCFQITSTTTRFSLSKVVRECSQLRELVCHIDGLWDSDFIFNKNIRTIKLSQGVTCNAAFLNNLSQYHRLERLSLDFIDIKYCDFDILADVLQKLKNLTAIVIKRGAISLGGTNVSSFNFQLTSTFSSVSLTNRLVQTLKPLKDERPAFYYSLGEFRSSFNIPQAHLDLM